MSGLNRRSKRAGFEVPLSFAFWWKAPLDKLQGLLAEGTKELLVVQGTTLLPPPCAVAQPVGNVPGAAPSKFSLKIVVALGVPVKSVWCSIGHAEPRSPDVELELDGGAGHEAVADLHEVRGSGWPGCLPG